MRPRRRPASGVDEDDLRMSILVVTEPESLGQTEPERGPCADKKIGAIVECKKTGFRSNSELVSPPIQPQPPPGILMSQGRGGPSLATLHSSEDASAGRGDAGESLVEGGTADVDTAL